MKKILLVLMVVAMASFLFVGCLPGIVDDGDGDDVDDDVVEVAMTIEKEYTDADGVTFVACGKDVIVTLPITVEVDYVVYVAVKVWDETLEVYEYHCKEAGTPDATRTVWTFTDYTGICGEAEVDECEPICLVAIVQHPCCPGEEVALRIVSLDCTPPELDLFVKFTDCEDECIDPDPCVPAVPGAYMEWTSRTTGICDTVDCCKDACSGDNGWSLVVDPDICLGPCDTVTGTGCPVEGVLDCGCLSYATAAEVTPVRTGIHYVDFTFEDNVGNTVKSTWKLTFDTDSLVTFEVDDTPSTVFTAERTLTVGTTGWYTVYDDPTCPPATFE